MFVRCSVVLGFLIGMVHFNASNGAPQDAVRDAAANLQVRNDLLLSELPEFSLTYSRYETEVLEPRSLARGEENVRWRIDRSGRDWAITKTFLNPRVMEGVLIPEEPHFIVLKNRELFDWLSNGTMASVSNGMNRLIATNHFRYFRLAGFDAGRALFSDAGTNWAEARGVEGWRWLPADLQRHIDEYTFERTDRGTVLLRSELDEIELDPNRGYCLVRRFVRDLEQGHPVVEVIASDIREVSPGLWLPFHLEQHRYGHVIYGRQDSEWKKIGISRYRIDDFSLTADASAFDPVMPPGTSVHDTIRGITYQVTTDTDPFLGTEDEAIEILRRADRRGPYWPWVLGITALLLLAGVITFFVWRNRQQ